MQRFFCPILPVDCNLYSAEPSTKEILIYWRAMKKFIEKSVRFICTIERFCFWLLILLIIAVGLFSNENSKERWIFKSLNSSSPFSSHVRLMSSSKNRLTSSRSNWSPKIQVKAKKHESLPKTDVETLSWFISSESSSVWCRFNFCSSRLRISS